jgi:hypothetical protein
VGFDVLKLDPFDVHRENRTSDFDPWFDIKIIAGGKANRSRCTSKVAECPSTDPKNG